MIFPIHPNKHVLIGDNNAIQEITTNMNDESEAYNDTPTEPTPERTQLIDGEKLSELYDGKPPYQHLLDTPEHADDGDSILQDGQVVTAEETESNGSETV